MQINIIKWILIHDVKYMTGEVRHTPPTMFWKKAGTQALDYPNHDI